MTDDDTISRIKAALEAKALTEPATPEEFASAQEWLFIVCPPTTLSYLLDRLKAAEAENERLRKALTDVIADLEIEGGDGWMTGQVHSDEYKAARAALENPDAR
jgi:hypothetical protein